MRVRGPEPAPFLVRKHQLQRVLGALAPEVLVAKICDWQEEALWSTPVAASELLRMLNEFTGEEVLARNGEFQSILTLAFPNPPGLPLIVDIKIERPSVVKALLDYLDPHVS